MSTPSRKNCDHSSKYCDLVPKHSKFYIVTDSTKLPIITGWSINFQHRLEEKNSSNVKVSATSLCMTNIFSFCPIISIIASNSQSLLQQHCSIFIQFNGSINRSTQTIFSYSGKRARTMVSSSTGLVHMSSDSMLHVRILAIPINFPPPFAGRIVFILTPIVNEKEIYPVSTNFTIFTHLVLFFWNSDY